jgi:D-alanine--(R)-lactate ligase
MDRLTVGILFGGSSEEHPISVKSAQEVARYLDLERYRPRYIGVTRSGSWFLCDAPHAGWEHGVCRPAMLSPDRSAHGLLVLDHGRYDTVRLDLAFPVLHGRLGEDGAMQGLLELSGIPYVGCDVQSSALCMDKSLAYTVARDAGIATPTFVAVASNEDVEPDRFTYPVFVKPARSGSSFGVSKVARADDLNGALEAARAFDSKVLIEDAVDGSEVGCAILADGLDLIPGEVDQIDLSHGFFRIHQEREPEQGSDNATVVVPADISTASRSLVQETAKAVYRALGCRGLARVDMFLQGDGSVVLNEVNTLPGLTSYSRFPRMMASAGLPFAEVIDRLFANAMSGASDGR